MISDRIYRTKASYFEIAIVVTMLAATDAALGKAVVIHEAIPANIREGLNVESGLNDGICVPVLFVFIALATGSGAEDGGLSLALKLVLREIGIGSGRPYVRPDRPGRCFKYPLRTASTGAVYGVSGK